jgi:hypothetical protein
LKPKSFPFLTPHYFVDKAITLTEKAKDGVQLKKCSQGTALKNGCPGIKQEGLWDFAQDRIQIM